MKLEVLYHLKYDFQNSQLRSSSYLTVIVKATSIDWDGNDSPARIIEAAESDFLKAEHPDSGLNSYNHKNHRIEITGLRFGGAEGLVICPLQIMTILAGK